MGGGGIGSLARGGGGLHATHYYHMHTSRGCLGAWGYRGMYAIIAISCLCREESLKGLKDQRHSSSSSRIEVHEWAWEVCFTGDGGSRRLSRTVRAEGGLTWSERPRFFLRLGQKWLSVKSRVSRPAGLAGAAAPSILRGNRDSTSSPQTLPDVAQGPQMIAACPQAA